MIKEVRQCRGEYHQNVIMKSCEECNDQAICDGHTKYVVKFLPTIIESIEGRAPCSRSSTPIPV